MELHARPLASCVTAGQPARQTLPHLPAAPAVSARSMLAGTLLVSGGLSLAGSAVARLFAEERKETERWLRSAFQPPSIRSELRPGRGQAAFLLWRRRRCCPCTAFHRWACPVPLAGLTAEQTQLTIAVQAHVRAAKPLVAELSGWDVAVVRASARPPAAPPAGGTGHRCRHATTVPMPHCSPWSS